MGNPYSPGVGLMSAALHLCPANITVCHPEPCQQCSANLHCVNRTVFQPVQLVPVPTTTSVANLHLVRSTVPT